MFRKLILKASELHKSQRIIILNLCKYKFIFVTFLIVETNTQHSKLKDEMFDSVCRGFGSFSADSEAGWRGTGALQRRNGSWQSRAGRRPQSSRLTCARTIRGLTQGSHTLNPRITHRILASHTQPQPHTL